MRRLRRRLATLAFFVGAAWAWWPGLAAEANGLDAKKRAAKTACLAGDYGKGVALLAEIYVDTNNPIYLFNQGRCFQQNGRYEEAVTRFREYQRKNADAGGAHDPEAEKQIAECLSLLDAQKAAEAKQEAKAWEAVGEQSGAAATGPAPPFAGTPAGGAAAGTTGGGPPAPAADTSWPIQKKLGYIAAGIGVVSLGASLTAYLMGKSYLDKSSRLGCSDVQCVGEAKDEYNRAQTAMSVANVTGISGGVLLIGGVVLILTSPSSAQPVALVPVVRPGLAQLAVTGSF